MTWCSCYITACHKQLIRNFHLLQRKTKLYKTCAMNCGVERKMNITALHLVTMPQFSHQNKETAPSGAFSGNMRDKEIPQTATINGLLQLCACHHLYCVSLFTHKEERGVFIPNHETMPYSLEGDFLYNICMQLFSSITSLTSTHMHKLLVFNHSLHQCVTAGDCDPLCSKAICSCCPAGCLNHT